MLKRRTIIPLLVLALCVRGSAADGARFKLYDEGTEDIVDYEKYGEFKNVGTANFHYVVKDRVGLALASGEGIDPSQSITNNPEFVQAKAEGKLKGDWWRHVQTSNPQLDYFVWANAPEDPGVRLLFVGKALEKGGHFIHALKAYRAAMILYPDSACWSSGAEFQWDVATAAWNNIQNLLRRQPGLGIRLVGADVVTKADASKLNIIVTPGRLERIETAPAAETVVVSAEETAPASDPEPDVGESEEKPDEAAAETVEEDEEQIGLGAVVSQRGKGKVQLVQYENGHWRMLVEGKPYFIRGMNYSPTVVGVKPWEWNWLWADENTNGIVDSFEVFVDANTNNRQDEDEPTVCDFQLLKEMGCNTIKLHITDDELPNLNYLTLRRMYDQYGIRVIVGNFLGAYCHGSGANWEQGTDYTIRKQRESMKASVSNLVMKLKDEPWVLGWVLGNENNMDMSGDVNATRTNASKYPETYAKFLNDVAMMIHELDPDHPVGTGNLLTGLVEHYGKLAPELDFLGVNSYLGEEGFGATWQKVKQTMDKPVVIAEFGCDSYRTGKGSDEEMQTSYLVGNWEDIAYNRAGGPGLGNSIGGFVFEWLDEWWKDSLNYFEDPVDRQSTRAVFPMPFPDGFAQEEWFGIMSQGSGKMSPFLRQPKKAYFAYKDLWLKEVEREEAEWDGGNVGEESSKSKVE